MERDLLDNPLELNNIFNKCQNLKYEILRWTGDIIIGVGGGLMASSIAENDNYVYSTIFLATGLIGRSLAYNVKCQTREWFYNVNIK